jgi:ATP-dependent protease ClpP protease subunit
MSLVIEHAIKEVRITEWTLYGAIDEFSHYKTLIAALKEAQEGDMIHLLINSTGGSVDVGMMIVQAMQSSKATVITNVVYPSYSMGAIIAVAGDYLTMQPHSFLMFHTYSTGMGGKSGDLIKLLSHDDESLKGMMQDICVPFLTKNELKKMHAGDDIYITAKDPTLSTRIKRHFKGVVSEEV